MGLGVWPIVTLAAAREVERQEPRHLYEAHTRKPSKSDGVGYADKANGGRAGVPLGACSEQIEGRQQR